MGEQRCARVTARLSEWANYSWQRLCTTSSRALNNRLSKTKGAQLAVVSKVVVFFRFASSLQSSRRKPVPFLMLCLCSIAAILLAVSARHNNEKRPVTFVGKYDSLRRLTQAG